jgi:SAM-dependent methyltransferase
MTMSVVAPPPPDAAAENYRAGRIDYWDDFARRTQQHPGLGGYYHRRLAEVYRFVIPPHQRVLELGCGRGDLLASLDCSRAVGVELSGEMIAQGKARHANVEFMQADALSLELDEKFDYIILSDLINDLWDVQRVFLRLRAMCTPKTRVVLNFFSHLWEWPMAAAAKLRLANPLLRQNWLTAPDVQNLLYLSGFETLRKWEEVLWPVRSPGIDALSNKFLVKLWPFKHLALTNFMLARLLPEPHPEHKQEPTVTVVVAARNEAGNVDNIFARTPDMGGGTELIFVEGGSSDNTYEAIERAIAQNPGRNVKLFKQTGKGKGDAVRVGFANATGDILMILDADLTVPPEDLPQFYDAIADGKGEFVNGVRLVYPMEAQAMRFANLAGNKFFSAAFSWILGQPIKDTLCGTKVIRRNDYQVLAENRGYFGDFDPFGDFDLLFGAAKLNLKIVDLPVRYRERTYGSTNIERWKHGWLLLKMVVFAARKMKFV